MMKLFLRLDGSSEFWFQHYGENYEIVFVLDSAGGQVT